MMDLIFKIMSFSCALCGVMSLLFALVVHVANNAKGYYGTVWHWPSILWCSAISAALFIAAYLLWGAQ